MKLEIYAMKDNVIGEFQNPFLQHNEAHAVRTLTESVNDFQPNHINKNVQDMQLYRLGYFDTITGEIKQEIKFVKNAISVKRSQEQ